SAGKKVQWLCFAWSSPLHGDFQLGNWLVVPKLNSLACHGKTVRLEPKIMQVLVCLAEAGDVVSKEVLMRKVWTDTFVTDDVLTRSMSALRKALADASKKPQPIQTNPKGAYRLIAPWKLPDAHNGDRAAQAAAVPLLAPALSERKTRAGRRKLP